jgi:hypothetical protein
MHCLYNAPVQTASIPKKPSLCERRVLLYIHSAADCCIISLSRILMTPTHVLDLITVLHDIECEHGMYIHVRCKQNVEGKGNIVMRETEV